MTSRAEAILNGLNRIQTRPRPVVATAGRVWPGVAGVGRVWPNSGGAGSGESNLRAFGRHLPQNTRFLLQDPPAKHNVRIKTSRQRASCTWFRAARHLELQFVLNLTFRNRIPTELIGFERIPSFLCWHTSI